MCRRHEFHAVHSIHCDSTFESIFLVATKYNNSYKWRVGSDTGAAIFKARDKPDAE